MTKQELSRICTGFAMALQESNDFVRFLTTTRDKLREQADLIDEFLKVGYYDSFTMQSQPHAPNHHVSSWYETMVKELDEAE